MSFSLEGVYVFNFTFFPGCGTRVLKNSGYFVQVFFNFIFQSFKKYNIYFLLTFVWYRQWLHMSLLFSVFCANLEYLTMINKIIRYNTLKYILNSYEKEDGQLLQKEKRY